MSRQSPRGPRPPRQDRSRRTLERIAEAALDLIAERGVEGASVQDIVDRAHSSVGSFYARFDGKDDLVRWLESRVWEAASERWEEGIAAGVWIDAPLADLIEGLIRLLVRIERTDAGQRNALAGGHRSGAPDGGPAAAFRDRVARDVGQLVLDRREELAHPDPRRAVALLTPVLMGALRALGERADEPAVLGELSRMALAYLGSAPPEGGAASGEAMDFFDVWG